MIRQLLVVLILFGVLSITATAAAVETEHVEVPEPTDKAIRYYQSGTVLWWLSTLLSLLIPALFLFTGLAARLRNIATKGGRRWFPALALFVTLYTLTDYLLNLPLSFYSGFVRQHAYELSNQTFGKWLGDSLMGMCLALGASVLFLWIPFLLVKKSPRRWWLYTGLAGVPFIVIGMLIAPLLIDPLFNDFGPMQDKELEAAILATAERAGIASSRVFEVDKSIDTNAVNAYITGFGNTKRIVLWDTIISKLDRDQLVFVMGHELGHYALHHVVEGIIFYSLLILIALYLTHKTARWAVDRWGERWGFSQLHDFAALPLAVLLLGIYSFLLMPLALGYSRFLEHEADRFGLELIQDNHAAASTFARLQEENLSNPRPGLLYKIWRASHPPLGERIDFCNDYRPWATGEPLRYERLMGPSSQGAEGLSSLP